MTEQSGFKKARCPYCAKVTTVEYVIKEEYEWAKIDCPRGHVSNEFSPGKVSDFVERLSEEK